MLHTKHQKTGITTSEFISKKIFKLNIFFSKRQNRRSAGKNNRRSAAGDFHKNSKSNQNRQKHFNMIKKGGKNRNSKPSRVQTKKGNK